jgi:hypothetical protein
MGWCILLTTTVNVHQVPFIHQKTKEERLETYLKSIHQWLATDLPIVVVENSGYTFPELKDTRAEIITMNCDESQPFLNLKNAFGLKDKGIYEIHSINYACRHSYHIQNSTHVMKITGRYFIPCLEGILKTLPDTKAVRQRNPSQCEIVGCRKDYINTVFSYVLLNRDNKITEIVEEVYQYRISRLPHIVLPIMPIEPTKRGGLDEIKTFL